MPANYCLLRYQYLYTVWGINICFNIYIEGKSYFSNYNHVHNVLYGWSRVTCVNCYLNVAKINSFIYYVFKYLHSYFIVNYKLYELCISYFCINNINLWYWVNLDSKNVKWHCLVLLEFWSCCIVKKSNNFMKTSISND